jgi:hypothetical protein
MSKYADLLRERAAGNTAKPAKPATKGKEVLPKRLSDFPETEASHFIIRAKGRIIAEGSLTSIKFWLDESYLNRKIKEIRRDREAMTVSIDY